MIYFVYIVFAIVVGFIGDERKIGFWTAFLASLLFSPIIGFILVLMSGDREIRNG
ncbi:hypothetical protein WG906_17145 [Pedobacter sp. P351]|uniref:hypothetical protein n=1 Tax=Pedobacter superstes TaxID=3133441 RepID=UPI0030AB58FF